MKQDFDVLHYFTASSLFEESILKDWCERHSVNLITSSRFPQLAMLHYSDNCIFDNGWSSFSQASRGIIVDLQNKTLLAVPFFKFFGLDQQPETSYDVLKDEHFFEVSEKLDGSLLISFLNPNDNQFYLTTKGSFDSEHGHLGSALFKNLPNYQQVLEYAKSGTLMFELIDSRFRIVIDYKKKEYSEGLYLIGYRTREGCLLTYAEVAELAKELGLPCPKTYSFDSLDTLLAKTKDLPMSEEGFVLRYPSGLMVKVKGAAYLRAHKFISHLSDKNILEAVKEGVEGPFVEICPDEFRDEVVEKIAYFKGRKLDILNQCYKYFAEAPKENGRKEFALWVNANVKSSLRGCLFQLMDCKPLKDSSLYDIIKEIEKPSVETRI